MQALRRAHTRAIANVAPENLVFVDECGANLSFCRLWARSPKGLRAFGATPQNWGENVSILGALSLRGTLASMHVEGSTDGAVFLTYVRKVLAPQLWPGALVIMDNLSSHKVAGVEEAILAAGARLHYLPPYSPDLNPIEQAWSKLKSYLRSVAARSYCTLSRAISAGLNLITPADAHSFFVNCGYHG